MFKVINIIRGTTVDGPGLRTSIYLAGCTHQCIGCQNPQSWDPLAGEPMTLEEILEIVKEEDFNVTFSGGDPLYYSPSLSPLLKEIKSLGKNIWIYTGFTWEEIIDNNELKEIVKWADVLVDGRYIEELRDLDLRFRGSSNQRLIDIQESLKQDKIILYQ